jgi:uncharacterized OB-fold protein
MTMSGEMRPLTIDSFFRYCSEGKLMSAKCEKCGSLSIPPRELCPMCLSSDVKWVELNGTGELLTYTVVHVPPPLFQGKAPYVIGIVRLKEGVTLSGLVRETPQENLKVGMTVKVKFEHVEAQKWQPQSRYFFVPA